MALVNFRRATGAGTTPAGAPAVAVPVYVPMIVVAAGCMGRRPGRARAAENKLRYWTAGRRDDAVREAAAAGLSTSRPDCLIVHG